MSNNSGRRGMSPVLAFILGFLLALIVVVGAVAAVVVYALNYKLDNLDFNKDEESNYIYINADPDGETATLLQLVNKVMTMTGDTGALTLGQVEETFPIASKLSDALDDMLGSYVDIDMEELKATAFSKLGDFLQETVMDIKIASLLEDFAGDLADNEFLKLILYDDEGNAVTVRQLSDGSALDRLYSKPVLDLLDDGGDYGEITEEILGDMTVGDLLNGADFGDKVQSLTLDSFVKVDLNDGFSTTDTILAYVVYGVTDIEKSDGSIGGKEYTHTCAYNTLDGEKIKPCYLRTENGQIVEVFKIADDGSAEEIKGTSVNDISSRAEGLTHDLTLGEIIDVSGNKILEMIADSTIDGLSEDINGLAINELYADSIYASASGNEETALKYLAVSPSTQPSKAVNCISGYIYYVKDGENYVLASTTGKLTAFEDGKEYYTFGEGKIMFDKSYVYYDADGNVLNKGTDDAGKAETFAENLYTYGAANAMWKLLLYSDGSETAFSVNGITRMIDNVSQNIKSTTMYELNEAGIVDMSNVVDREIKVEGDYKGHTIGELTLDQLLDYFVTLLNMAENVMNVTTPSIPTP